MIYRKVSTLHFELSLAQVAHPWSKQFDETDAPSQSPQKVLSKTQAEKEKKRRQKARIVVEHVDIIKDTFWQENPLVLAGKGFKLPIE